MSNAPKEIWAGPMFMKDLEKVEPDWEEGGGYWDYEQTKDHHEVRYIRADVAEAAIARLKGLVKDAYREGAEVFGCKTSDEGIDEERPFSDASAALDAKGDG